MGFLESIPFIPIVLFIFGILYLQGGIRILRQRKVTLPSRDPSLQHWNNPETVVGKKSKFWGTGYIVQGIFLIALAALTYIGGF